jgi:phosphoglycerate kinase
VAIVGGAKVAEKLGIVKGARCKKADTVIVGGGMAYTFASSQGRSIGSSLFDALRTRVRRHPAQAATCSSRATRGLSDGRALRVLALRGGDDPVVEFDDIPDGFEGLDIGPESVRTFVEAIAGGDDPVERPDGRLRRRALRRRHRSRRARGGRSGAVSVVGGGDSVAALKEYGLEGAFSFVSTGGGASLEFVELGDLPGLQALRESQFN